MEIAINRMSTCIHIGMHIQCIDKVQLLTFDLVPQGLIYVSNPYPFLMITLTKALYFDFRCIVRFTVKIWGYADFICYGKYMKVRGKTRHGLKMIQNDGIQVWNSIPHEIRNLPSVKTFLQQYKTYLMYGVI